MRKPLMLVYLLLALFVTATAFAAEFTIDLAKESAVTRNVPPGTTIHLTIINELDVKYTITTTRGVVEAKLPPPQLPAGAPGAVIDCADAEQKFLDALKTKKTESEVATLILSTDTSQCPGLKDAIAAKTHENVLDDVPLTSGEQFTVTITRPDGNNTLTWTFTATTGAPGEFKIFYGFNFIPSRDDRYFLAQSDDGKKFTITQANRRQRFDFAPSMFFTFLTNNPKLAARGLEFAPVAGLGFDMSNPIVFGGVTASFRRNLSLNVGVVVHQERRLNGKYNVGDPSRNTVTENLTDDQLYEKTYAPRIFFGLGFRFEENPFAKKNDAKK